MANRSNQNRGTDYHLRALGFEDRESLLVLAADNQVYSDGLIVSRPDWLIFDQQSNVALITEYKSRCIGDGVPSLYEEYEVIASMIAVASHLNRIYGRPIRVNGALVYGDGALFEVNATQDECIGLYKAAMEAVSYLYFIGATKKPSTTISATNLARFMVDPSFSDPVFESSEFACVGVEAHDTMMNLGPRFTLEKIQVH